MPVCKKECVGIIQPRLLFLNHDQTKVSIKHTFIYGLLSLAILNGLPQGAFAQIGSPVLLNSVDNQDLKIYQNKLADEYPDSMSVVTALEELLADAQMKAHLVASVDRLYLKDSSQWIADFYLGPKVQWARLENGNIPEPYWKAAGLNSGRFESAPLIPENLARAQERLLEQFENNGYPFARVYLDSLQWLDKDQVQAFCFVNRGPLIVFDEIKVEGDVKISKAYLENYLGIKEGMPYSRAKILRMRARLQELPFLQEKKDPSITFWRDKSLMTLNLERKKASRFDFLIGVLPTDQFSGRRVLITGVLNAALQNQFGLGETLIGRFEQLRPGTQELEITFNYPYVLQLPFGIDAGFQQYRRDSTFNDVIFDLGLRYLLEGGNYIKAFWNQSNSGLISLNTEQIINQRSLPENLDIQNTRFGLEYANSQVDYRRNPRKGWQLLVQGSIGFKRINQNTQITELEDPTDPAFDFTTLYDTLTLNSTQYRGGLTLSGFLPLFKTMTLMGRFQGGYIGADQPIYQNEQYRIGGAQLLRGFDEESLFSSLYGIFTLEFRLLLDRNSFIYLFGDYAYTEDITTTNRSFDRPIGFGGGLTFDTKAGLFGISVAMGRQHNNPFDFRNPKIHFGYVSFF